MPRIRTIKPEFWTSAQVIECSTNARLLFVGLWNFADDSGRHPDNEKQCKAEVFPSDDFTLEDVRTLLDELVANELIVPYEVENRRFFYISGWHHQKIDRPQPSKYPAPIDEQSTNDRRTFVPDSKGKEGIGKDRKEIHMSTFVDVWNTKVAELKESGFSYHAVAKLTKARKSKLAVRLRDPEWESSFRQAVSMLPIHQWDSWVPDFDWMIANDDNVLKVVEGKYHKRDFTQDDKNKRIIDSYEPGVLATELLNEQESERLENLGTDPVRRLS